MSSTEVCQINTYEAYNDPHLAYSLKDVDVDGHVEEAGH